MGQPSDIQPSAGAELYNQKITSIFPTVSEALIHIYTADYAFWYQSEPELVLPK